MPEMIPKNIEIMHAKINKITGRSRGVDFHSFILNKEQRIKAAKIKSSNLINTLSPPILAIGILNENDALINNMAHKNPIVYPEPIQRNFDNAKADEERNPRAIEEPKISYIYFSC
ncbi:MAG: hypothetical protein KJ880_06565 [Candidatus Omnitrophica bacterium]|nr:hypothetical protein [Candidatus Omnitrophota bacterium]MBU1868996.1 hypothetical protein [Candidatus Omnitrophota bacterium]